MSEDWDEPEFSTPAGNTAAFQPVTSSFLFAFFFVSDIFISFMMLILVQINCGCCKS